MEKLLREWAVLAPNEITISENKFVLTTWEDITQDMSLVGISRFKLAIIQAAVQEAIEARGWQYEQRAYGSGKVSLVYVRGYTKLIKHEFSNMAESLLAAYVEALEVARSEQYKDPFVPRSLL